MSSKSSSAGHVSIDVILISTVVTFSNLTVTFSPPADPSTVIVYVYVLPTGTSCEVIVVVEVVVLIRDKSLNTEIMLNIVCICTSNWNFLCGCSSCPE